MRKLKLQMQISLDGYVEASKGRTNFNWDDEVRNYSIENTNGVDCILLGRNTAEGFIPHWEGVANNPTDPDLEFGKRVTDISKTVFSRKLKNSKWKNAKLAKGKIVEEISKLKKQKGKDIIVYGGSSFVALLLKYNLVDELHLLVNPVAFGDGVTIYDDIKKRLSFTLMKCQSFGCGTVLLCYTTNGK